MTCGRSFGLMLVDLHFELVDDGIEPLKIARSRGVLGDRGQAGHGLRIVGLFIRQRLNDRIVASCISISTSGGRESGSFAFEFLMAISISVERSSY